ncbi:hypothetical protein TYRP_008472 [Tyrophagus putrescentiae]|nr:hypothetical protein TYRP_008472 [Tyrophagus putrescentiae]
MNGKWTLSFVLVALLLCCLAVFSSVEGAYRKPPFNGSIFGKRSSGGGSAGSGHGQADTEAADLSNACELAAQLIPVCSQWINKMNELASRR